MKMFLLKFTSRKWWAMVGAVLVALFAGDTIDAQQLTGLLVAVAAYILGESYVDGKRSSPK